MAEQKCVVCGKNTEAAKVLEDSRIIAKRMVKISKYKTAIICRKA